MRLALLAILLLTGCTTTRVTLPQRSATEQLLISEAAEAAAVAIHLNLGSRKAFLDTTNFEGVDARYAMSAIRESLLRQGNAIVDNRDLADTIIEVRAGALSIDSATKVLGIPSVDVPRFFIPGLNIVSRTRNTGVARFSLFAYDRATGKLVALVAPVTGYSRRDTKSFGSVIAWSAQR
ncbi:MAG: hypothetical protein EOO77_16225 [Oxalobacteraceae bacterium]|jgi:hypothetical protein|nr:MAG: hypothetical protein EOO77_16225 [Oxalobacteraceae bacterium]